MMFDIKIFSWHDVLYQILCLCQSIMCVNYNSVHDFLFEIRIDEDDA